VKLVFSSAAAISSVFGLPTQVSPPHLPLSSSMNLLPRQLPTSHTAVQHPLNSQPTVSASHFHFCSSFSFMRNVRHVTTFRTRGPAPPFFPATNPLPLVLALLGGHRCGVSRRCTVSAGERLAAVQTQNLGPVLHYFRSQRLTLLFLRSWVWAATS
jgi:hypothetical protein